MSRHAARFTHHAIAAAALAALHLGAQAQATAEAGKLGVITITAERHTEDSKEVPVSASVIQGELLDVLNTSGQDVRMLSGRVPSLNVESSFGRAFPRFYIRGYGNTDFRLNASQPVSLVYDDIVQENPILKGFPAFDLAGIEVLRGPQGSLFGRNTPAGVVKFDSVKPSKKTDGYGSISFGSYTTINAEGAGNITLGSDTTARLSLLDQTRSDWVNNTIAAGPTQKLEGYRDSALRGQILYEPGKDLSVLASIHARDYKGSARLFRANIIKPGTNDLVDGFDPAKISIDGKNTSEVQNYGANLHVKAGLDGGLVLNSITGFESVHTYSRGDIDGGYSAVFAQPSGPGTIPFSSETADGMPKHQQLTQEFRLESVSTGPLNWQAGVYLFQEKYTIESFSYDSLAPGNPQNGYERVRQKNDAYALFAGLNYAVSPALKLRGGLRYTHDKKTFDVDDYNNSGFAPCIGPTIGIEPKPIRCTYADLLAAEGPGGSLSASPSTSKLSWDLGGTYSLDRDTNFYARAATGFRGNSVQGASAFNTKSVAAPETSLSFEAGVKAELFNRRARLNFGLFHYDVNDLQLTAVGGSSNSNILLNAKKASGQGFELDLQAFITDNLLATVGVSYNDTKIKDSNLVVSACGTLMNAGQPKANCTILDPVSYKLIPENGNYIAKANINGNPLPQAPKTTASFTLKYTQPLAGGDAYVFTDWVYRDKVNFSLYEATEFTGKALLEGGLRVGYTWGNGKYDAAAYVRNLTNQIRIVGGIDFNNLTGFINDPRTYGVQFKATF
jgi:iron complex outermembrane receptor protein